MILAGGECRVLNPGSYSVFLMLRLRLSHVRNQHKASLFFEKVLLQLKQLIDQNSNNDLENNKKDLKNVMFQKMEMYIRYNYVMMFTKIRKLNKVTRRNPSLQFLPNYVTISESRQYLRLAQYCASSNRGVMPVLPVNTVSNIGIVLTYYWRGIFWQYWWDSKVGVSLTVVTLPVYYGRQYWLLWPLPADSTGPVLPLSTSPVLTANSQPSYHQGYRQYCASTENPTGVLTWYRASSKFPPGLL